MRKFKVFFSTALMLFMLCLNILPSGLLIGGFTSFPVAAAASDEAWSVANAGARQEITIHNPTQTAFTDLPVLVRLTSSNIPDKDGVSFYLGATRLSSELANWNASGISTYWVKLLSLEANADTVITAYYSGSKVEALTPETDVWSDNYELVQHFSESALNASKDSTGNGTLSKAGSLTYKQDFFGGAAAFTGAQKISYTNRVFGANATAFSASAVVKFTSLAGSGGYYGIVCRDRNGAQTGDTFMLTMSNTNVNSSVYTNGSLDSRVNIQKSVTAGTPYLLTMTYDGANLNLYINGALVESKPSLNATLLDSTLSPLTIGAYSDTEVKSGLKGDLYDVFFKTSVISADEENFRYANYFGDAVTVGAIETNDSQSTIMSPGTHYLYNAIMEDTYCFSNGDANKTKNFGSDTVVMQKRTKADDTSSLSSSANRRAFIKLDLTELYAVAPTRIESVSFDFYQNGNGGTTTSASSKIVDLEPDSWDESAVTWNTMPATYGLPAVATQTLTKKEKEYQSFDITNYIKDKIAEGKTTVSFSIDNEPANEWGLIWNSREAAENKPRLSVKIKESAPPVLSSEVDGTSAALKVQLEQNPGEATEVNFYQAKSIPLTAENTVVYSGVTSETLADGLTIADADTKEAIIPGEKTTVGNGKTPYQIYEVTLSEEEKAQNRIDVTWTGNTGGHQRDVTAYFYDHTSNKWVKADSRSGEGSFSLDLTIPVSAAVDQSCKVQILIWRGLNESIEGRSSYAPGVGQYDFNIMWVTDTQKYFAPISNLPHVQKQFNWISDNFDAMNSKLLIHTGDMVENYDDPEQWKTMRNLYDSTIDAKKIPHAFTVGNHDVNRTDSSKNIFQDYFSIEYLQKNNPYFGETFGDDMTYYYLMEENGAKFMFVGLGIPITQAAVNWVNDALARHPDYTAVLMPHIYLLPDGSVDNTNRYGSEVTIEKLRTIISQNDNVRLVLCGHHTGASVNLEYFGDHPVWSMMYDYQDLAEGGKGYFRFLKFDIENNLIYTHTYSASDNGTAMFTDKQPAITGMYQKYRDEYAISFDFRASGERTLTTESLSLKIQGTAGEQIGSTQTVLGSGSASVVWNNLEEGETYTWYAVLKDGSGKEISTNVQTFAIPKIVIDDVIYANHTVTVCYTASGMTDGTPVGIMAFAVEENDGPDTVWNGQNVAYHDVFEYCGAKSTISFPMPRTTEGGIAGYDTTKVLLIKMGGEYTNTDAKLFVMPIEPEIVSSGVDESGNVTVRLNRPLQSDETLIVSVYGDQGTLLEMKNETAETVSAQRENEYVVEITVPEDSKTIKALWWNGIGTMQPICEPKTLKKVNEVWLEE